MPHGRIPWLSRWLWYLVWHYDLSFLLGSVGRDRQPVPACPSLAKETASACQLGLLARRG